MRLHTLVPFAVIFAALASAGTLKTAAVSAGSLVKAESAAVYYLGEDGKRYVFPNDKIYFSWYADWSQVVRITEDELASYPIGGNVTYRPGTRLVKIQSDPKVYAVGKGGALRWINNETAAIALYGADWKLKVDDLSDSFFVNYSIGADIGSAGDFSPEAARSASSSISLDKGLASSGEAPQDPEPQETGCPNACTLGSACAGNVCREVPGPSALAVKAFIFDSVETCFVGDPCTGGSCCSVAGTSFADNPNLKSIRPVDKYLYADKQQLCGKSYVSAADRNRVTSELDDFARAASSGTANRMSVSVSQTRLSGQSALSRVPGTCSWWLAPSDVRERMGGMVDSSADAVFVVSSNSFDFGSVETPSRLTVDQSAGLSGTGYTFIVKEWEKDVSGAPDHTAYSEEFAAQMASSAELGITDPGLKFVGNHCRDGKRDFDETGVDCGGLGCSACAY